MTDKTIAGWFASNPITLDPGDIFPATENTGGTPVTGAAKVSQLMFNRYKITPTVAANELTIAVTHEDGNNPSTDRPLYFKIGDTLRAVTAALLLSVPKGTNFFNAGSAELGGQLVPFFVYVVWDSNSSVVALTISRKAHYRVVASTMSTTTSENHIFNYSNFIDGNNLVNIGFFEATLSLAGGYLWSAPTYTTANLKSEPTHSTEEYTYAPQWASSGTQPAIVNGTIIGKYSINGNQIFVNLRQTNGASTTYGTGTYTWSLPFTSKTITTYASNGSCQVYDNSATTFYIGRSSIGSNSAVATLATHGTTALVGPTVPITLATSDVLDFANVYYTL